MNKLSRIQINPVPYADTDASGYVHHARILEYMERGRVDLFNLNGMTIQRAEAIGYKMATHKADIHWVFPITHGQCLVVETTVVHINTYRIKTYARVLTSEQPAELRLAPMLLLCAEGETTTAFLDVDFNPRQMPEEAWSDEWDTDTFDRLREAFKTEEMARSV